MNMGLIRVNIHHTGKIPWLNIQGPRYDIGLSPSIYRLLKNDPRIQVFPVDADPVMEAKRAAKKAAKLAKLEPEVEIEDDVIEPEVEPEVEIEEEIQIEGIIVDTEDELIEDDECVEEYVEPQLNNLEVTDEDIAIELAAENFDDENDDEIEFTEEEVLKEAEELVGFVKYNNSELIDMTKADMKIVLNEDRGFEPATEFYGRYHDNHDVLLQKILDSQ